MSGSQCAKGGKTGVTKTQCASLAILVQSAASGSSSRCLSNTCHAHMAMPFDELQVGIKYYRRDRVCDGRSATGWLRRKLRRKFSSNYTETRKCHFCGKPGHLVMSCREKQIKDEMGKEANTNDNGKDDEFAAGSAGAGPDVNALYLNCLEDDGAEAFELGDSMYDQHHEMHSLWPGAEEDMDELLAKMLKDSADPLPLSQGDGTVRWQGVAV